MNIANNPLAVRFLDLTLREYGAEVRERCERLLEGLPESPNGDFPAVDILMRASIAKREIDEAIQFGCARFNSD